jgi:formylmethanofuran dehydrogenase subunit E
MDYADVVRFHGHSCPGLAIGFVMSRAALQALAGARAPDEELVAIVENNACGVDALQCLTGCTFGKGNLLFRDYGKHVYTLYCRETGRGVRVRFDEARVPAGLREDRQAFADWLLSDEGPSAVEVREVRIDEPPPARIHASVPCEACGEAVMETRLRTVGGRRLCIPCAEAESAGDSAR